MKKTYLFLLIGLFMFVDNYSQTEYKHFVRFGISLNSSFTNFNSEYLQNFSNQRMGTSFDYGIKIKKLLFGIGLEVINQSQDYDNSFIKEISYGRIWINPIARYCFNNGIYVHTQFNLGISFISKTFDSQVIITDNAVKDQQNYTLIGFTLGLGYSFKVGQRILIEPMIKYNFSHNKPLNEKYKSFGSTDEMIDIALIYKLK
jgi:hypothetical protein